MHLFVYISYGLLMLAFFILAGFAVFHAFKYQYISSRVLTVTWIFIIVSLVLVLLSLYLLFMIRFT